MKKEISFSLSPEQWALFSRVMVQVSSKASEFTGQDENDLSLILDKMLYKIDSELNEREEEHDI